MAVITVRYENTDLGLDAILKRASRARRTEAHVGFHDAGEAQIAAYQEFGTSTIPARPFMRTTFEANLERYKDALQEAAHNWLVGKAQTAGPGLRKAGNKLARDIKATIRSSVGPPNKQDEGAAGTLVVTGQMAASVKVKLE